MRGHIQKEGKDMNSMNDEPKELTEANVCCFFKSEMFSSIARLSMYRV